MSTDKPLPFNKSPIYLHISRISFDQITKKFMLEDKDQNISVFIEPKVVNQLCKIYHLYVTRQIKYDGEVLD